MPSWRRSTAIPTRYPHTNGAFSSTGGHTNSTRHHSVLVHRRHPRPGADTALSGASASPPRWVAAATASGCIDLRTIENATAPTASTTAPAAASISGRGRRRLAWRASCSACGMIRDHFLRGGELLRDRLLSGGQALGHLRAPIAVAHPHRRATGPSSARGRARLSSRRRDQTAVYFRPRVSRSPGVSRASVFELISHLSAACLQ